MCRRTVSWHGVIFTSNWFAGSFNENESDTQNNSSDARSTFTLSYFRLLLVCESFEILLIEKTTPSSKTVGMAQCVNYPINWWSSNGHAIARASQMMHKMRVYSQHVETFYFYILVDFAFVFISLFPLPVIVVFFSIVWFRFLLEYHIWVAIEHKHYRR